VGTLAAKPAPLEVFTVHDPEASTPLQALLQMSGLRWIASAASHRRRLAEPASPRLLNWLSLWPVLVRRCWEGASPIGWPASRAKDRSRLPSS